MDYFYKDANTYEIEKRQILFKRFLSGKIDCGTKTLWRRIFLSCWQKKTCKKETQARVHKKVRALLKFHVLILFRGFSGEIERPITLLKGVWLSKVKHLMCNCEKNSRKPLKEKKSQDWFRFPNENVEAFTQNFVEKSTKYLLFTPYKWHRNIRF